MKTLIESINTLNKNISEAAVEKETVLEGLQEFVDVINEDTETTVESIADAAEKIAEILPDKIGGGGISVNESYNISEGTLNGATYTLEGDITAHIPDGVVTIGKTAFKKNDIITKVIMADSVENIENGSYDDGAFYKCSKLKNVELSNNLTIIGSYAFYNCTGLTSITIPDSVTSIGDSAFYECNALTSLTLGNSVTSIGDFAFNDCAALTSLTIPDSITSIGVNAFKACNALTSLTLGNSVTSIGVRAFGGCKALTTLSIPDSVTSIGEHAFKSCYALTSLTIPDSVTRIGKSAFYNCKALTTVDMTAFDGTTVPTLANSTVFYADPHAEGFKFVFATQEALNAFASAPNWSSLSQYFEVAQA